MYTVALTSFLSRITTYSTVLCTYFMNIFEKRGEKEIIEYLLGERS